MNYRRKLHEVCTAPGCWVVFWITYVVDVCPVKIFRERLI